MTLFAYLHCPRCQGRLLAASESELRCSNCEQTIALTDGIADFVGDAVAEPCSGLTRGHGVLASSLPERIIAAAGQRWPAEPGAVIELGCGLGQMTRALAAGGHMRSLLVVDSDKARLLACQTQLREDGYQPPPGQPVIFAAAGGDQNIVRDAVADTVVGTAALALARDARAFLTGVSRMLKPGGRALFAVPNRRYWQAVCLAMADALLQHHAQHGTWSSDSWPVMAELAKMRRLILHLGTAPDQDGLRPFDADDIEHLGPESGFAAADVIPLSPDATGADTIERFCLETGTNEEFARDISCRAAVAGRRFFALLADRDASAYSLIWLTKADGPAVCFQRPRPTPPAMVYPAADLVLGGMPPRWSIELLGWETPDGIVVKIGGWCLSNADVLGVRVTLDDVPHDAAVGRYRPDVQEVMNQHRQYNAVNALFSGLEDQVLFPGAQADEHGCPLRIDILLAGDIALSGPAPDRLLLNQPMVVRH